MMKTVALTIATRLSVYCVAASQVPENEMFPLLITTVKRVNDGGTAEGESAKVRFRLSTDVSARARCFERARPTKLYGSGGERPRG